MTSGRHFVPFPRALLDLESNGIAAQNEGSACARKGRNHRRNVVLFPQPNPDEGGDDPDPSGSENGVGPLGGLPVFGSNQLRTLVGVEGRQGPGNVPGVLSRNHLDGGNAKVEVDVRVHPEEEVLENERTPALGGFERPRSRAGRPRLRVSLLQRIEAPLRKRNVQSLHPGVVLELPCLDGCSHPVR